MVNMELLYFLAQLIFILALLLLPLALIYPRAFVFILGRPIPRAKLTLVLLVILSVAFLTAAATQPDYIRRVDPQDVNGKRLHTVSSVIDGDTIRVRMDGQIEPVRLIGIDAPEIDYDGHQSECYARESTTKARELLDNRRVRLESDDSQGNRDTHGRLLRYVFLEDGTNFGRLMIAGGYAFESTFDAPYKYRQEFKQAEQTAKQDREGLWASDTCNGQKMPG